MQAWSDGLTPVQAPSRPPCRPAEGMRITLPCQDATHCRLRVRLATADALCVEGIRELSAMIVVELNQCVLDKLRMNLGFLVYE